MPAATLKTVKIVSLYCDNNRESSLEVKSANQPKSVSKHSD